MPALGTKTWRIKCQAQTPDDEQPEALVDVVTSGVPAVWRGNALDIAFAVFNPGDTDPVTDFSAYTHIVCELYHNQGTPSLLAPQKSIAIADLGSVTASQWTAKTHQHGTFSFTSDELSVAQCKAVHPAWLTIFANNDATDNRLTLCAGKVFIVQDRSFGGAAATPPSLHYTKAEITTLLSGVSAGALQIIADPIVTALNDSRGTAGAISFDEPNGYVFFKVSTSPHRWIGLHGAFNSLP